MAETIIDPAQAKAVYEEVWCDLSYIRELGEVIQECTASERDGLACRIEALGRAVVLFSETVERKLVKLGEGPTHA